MKRNYRLIRELNSQDIEIYKLQEYKTFNTLCYFMVYDTHRKPTIEDYSYLKGIIADEEIDYDNYLKAYTISCKNIDDELSEQICGIIEELTFHTTAPSLGWNNSFVKISSKEFKNIQNSRKYMLEFFNNLLKETGSTYDITTLKEKDYNNLSQSIIKKS